MLHTTSLAKNSCDQIATETSLENDSLPAGRTATLVLLTRSHQFLALVRSALEHDCVECVSFDNEVSMVRALKHGSFDLVLVDTLSAGHSSRAVLNWCACHSTERVPVLAVGSFSDRRNMLDMIDSGVTDLISTPFDKQELCARVILVLQRRRIQAAQPQSRIVVGPYVLDRKSNSISVERQTILLTGREFALAWLFFSNPNTTLSREQIACSVWGGNADIVDRTMEQHVYKLRKKIGLNKSFGIRLRACYAVGYRLEVVSLNQPGYGRLAAPVSQPTR